MKKQINKMVSLEKEIEGKKILLKHLPRRMIRTGEDLHKRGAKFEEREDEEGCKVWCAILGEEVWERITHEGHIKNHQYFLRATTTRDLQRIGFCGANGKYFHVIDGLQIIYDQNGEKVEYEESREVT